MWHVSGTTRCLIRHCQTLLRTPTNTIAKAGSSLAVRQNVKCQQRSTAAGRQSFITLCCYFNLRIRLELLLLTVFDRQSQQRSTRIGQLISHWVTPAAVTEYPVKLSHTIWQFNVCWRIRMFRLVHHITRSWSENEIAYKQKKLKQKTR